MRAFFVMVGGALVVLAVSGAGLAWDGAYQLFYILDAQQLLVPYGRFTKMLLFLPALLTSHVTPDPFWISLAYGVGHISMALIGLVTAWWLIARSKQTRALYVWVALVFAFGTLPGQICLVCETVEVVQLTLPLLLAILIGIPTVAIPLLAVLALLIFFFHPFAILTFALALMAVLAVAVFRTQDRRKMLWWAGGLAILLAVTAARFVLFHSSYEADQLSLPLLAGYYVSSLQGLATWAILLGWLTALLLVLERALGPRVPGLRYGLRLGTLASLVLAGLLWLIWALQPQLWSGAINFRALTFFASVPFFLGAIADALLPQVNLDLQKLWRERLVLIRVSAVIFATVVVIQSVTWFTLSQRLSATIAASPSACLSTDEMPWLQNTAMYHWAITSYALLIQGKTPQRIVERGAGCEETDFAEGLLVAHFDARDVDLQPWNKGWFDKQALKANTAELQAGEECHFPIGQGWDWIERDDTGWWRWTVSPATAIVHVDAATNATLTMGLNTTTAPNVVSMELNGVPLAPIALASKGFADAAAIPLALKAGDNLIRFASEAPPRMIPPDTRAIAIAVKNFQVTTSGGMKLCNW